MTEAELYQLIAERHPAPAWACFASVRNGTGFRRKTRTADALAMSLFPSRGLELHGFEIKSRKDDWHRELKDPDKAEDIASYCDRWWVVSPEGVVELDELPPAWGLLIPRKGKLIQLKAAEKTTAKPLDRLFLAAILRRNHESMEALLKTAIPEERLESKLQERYDAGHQDGLRKADAHGGELRDLKEKIKAFENASGLSIAQGWMGLSRDLGEAVKKVREARSIRDSERAITNDLSSARLRITNVLHSIDHALEELKDKKKAPRKKLLPPKLRSP